MHKIAIIAPSSRSYTPYVVYYEKILNDASIPYKIYYWDRFHINEKNIKGETFVCNCPTHGLGSIRGYIAYRSFLLNELRGGNYSFYIVLTVQMGILLYLYLHSKKFILDIRDFSHENKSLYRFFANSLIKKSAAVAISSDGFRSWLPKGREYLLSHNVSLELFNNDSLLPRLNPERFVISYIGGVSYYEANLRVINAISCNHKIILRYIGSGLCEKELETHCKVNKIMNVEFFGRYTPTQKLSLYEDTDFVLSCYGNNTELVRSLTPNRLYESCMLKRPIIANTGTYLADVVENYGLGIVINLENMDDLYEKMLAFTEHESYCRYIERCNKFIEKVRDDIVAFRLHIKDIVENI